jgi:hypothetical protein
MADGAAIAHTVLSHSNPNWTIYSGWQTLALKNNNLSKQSSAFITRSGRVGQYMLLIIAVARSAGHAQKGATGIRATDVE